MGEVGRADKTVFSSSTASGPPSPLEKAFEVRLYGDNGIKTSVGEVAKRGFCSFANKNICVGSWRIPTRDLREIWSSLHKLNGYYHEVL